MDIEAPRGQVIILENNNDNGLADIAYQELANLLVAVKIFHRFIFFLFMNNQP